MVRSGQIYFGADGPTNGNIRHVVTQSGYLVNQYYLNGTWYSIKGTATVPNAGNAVAPGTIVIPDNGPTIGTDPTNGQVDKKATGTGTLQDLLSNAHGYDSVTVAIDPVKGTVKPLDTLQESDVTPDTLVVGNGIGGITNSLVDDTGTPPTGTANITKYLLYGGIGLVFIVIIGAFIKKKPQTV